MKRILRPFLMLFLLLAASVTLVACGGDEGGGGGGGGGGGEQVSSDTDVNEVLEKAFASGQEIKSGVLTLSVNGSVAGEEAQEGEVTMSGPFENQGETQLPKLDWDVTASGGGQNIEAGIVNTGEKAFLSYQGTDYAVDDATYQQITQAFEQQAGQQNAPRSLEDLGLDPQTWLTEPENAGDSEVEGTETIKVTGGVNIEKLLSDYNALIEKGPQLGLGSDVGEPLTEEQIQQATEAIEDLSIEVDAGKEDGLLRRIAVTGSFANPDNAEESAEGTIEVTVAEVNEPQEFAEPENAQPLQELLGQFGGLGGLGALGGGGGGAGAGGGGSGGGAGGASQEDLEAYTQCLEEAGSDAAAAQECAAQLG